MGLLYSQASFKNSRISSRAPTTHAHTIVVPVAPGAYVKVLDADQTRTYGTINNTSLNSTIRYSYTSIPGIDTDGMPLAPGQIGSIDALEEIWAKNMGIVAVDVQIDYGQG